MQSTKLTWSGYLEKDGNRSELAFKDFACPPEGGEITGHTTDGRTAKGSWKESNGMVGFTLEGANCDRLFFEGEMRFDKASIYGQYGVNQRNLQDAFEIILQEV